MATVKAILKNQDGGRDIQFWLNPKEITVKNQMDTADNPGARSQQTGKPKVSFANLNPIIMTISNVVFDCYETQMDVVEKYIKPIEEATQFIDGKQRPPVYCFLWGRQYLEYCFVEMVQYKLTKFNQAGVPVRAVIDTLTLKETENPAREGLAAPVADPAQDNMQSRRSS